MARILTDADCLTVALTDLEKVEALHGDITVPRAAVVGVRIAAAGMSELHGIRAPGTGLPGVVAMGTWHDRGTRTFAACHGNRAAVVISLRDAAFDRLVVTVDDPAQVLAGLT
jgi:hypothetical protein